MVDNYEYEELLKELYKKLENIKNILNPDKIKKRLDEISTLELNPAFWDDAKNAGLVSKEKNLLVSKLTKYNKAVEALEDAKELFEIAQEENDTQTLQELYAEADTLHKMIKKNEIDIMLDDPVDDSNAIISIHPGAGGTESQDWALMLYRMYLRWAQRKGFKVQVLDYQEASEAGIKDVSFIIKGENAYGYLKVENGIHRLVRISPFDSNAKRHTSFSSVMVSPEVDDSINIDIEDKDIRIDTYRASGAGGQHVNKTESAIRITHIPTNIVVQCQNDRSQHKNKASAFKMLKSRLYELELEKQQIAIDGIEKSEIGWGHQIRSYVMQPYQQVKDNRNNKGYPAITNILDGDIDEILEDILVLKGKS
jgi:peptide chain release factor 2